MFETGIMKSGSDFESFRDGGHVPGLDITYANFGWIYHTKFDNIKYVSMDAIQNTGNNVLSLVKVLVNCEELTEPPEGSPVVFYDFIGLFFVSYTKLTGLIINIVVSILSVLVPFLVQTKLRLNDFTMIFKETLISFLTFTAAAILSLLACFAIGVIINSLDNAMFWFSSTILSLGVYCTLAVLVLIAVFHFVWLLRRKCWKSSSMNKDKYENRRKTQAHVNGINLFWAILTIIATSFGLRLGYIFMVMLLISLITNILTYVLHFIPKTCELSIRLQIFLINYLFSDFHSWIFVHFLGHAFTFLWSSYLVLFLWKVFIPLKEKTYDANPEIMIGLICGLMVILSISYFVSLASFKEGSLINYILLRFH